MHTSWQRVPDQGTSIILTISFYFLKGELGNKMTATRWSIGKSSFRERATIQGGVGFPYNSPRMRRYPAKPP
jgi:hypothetical protein